MGPVTARIGDVANSSRGLLPQLVDVLHALADCQELLTHRLRQAHLELLGVASSDGEESWRPLCPEMVRQDVRSPVPTNPAAGYDEYESFSSDTGNWTTVASGVDGSDSTSDLSVDPASALPNQPGVETSDTRTEALKSFDDFNAHQEMFATYLDGLEPTNPDTTNVDSGTRSYNFFDELDARLADLDSSGNGSEEAGS
jgi:hypothetical protein